jgi:hypothetical protein
MRVPTQAKLFASCPCCEDGEWPVGHLKTGTQTTWVCDCCQSEVRIHRIDEFEVDAEPTGRKATPVTITLESATEPKITVRLNTWKYPHSQNDSPADYAAHQQYYYNEHTCPTNWTSEIAEMIFKDDHDPHGVFQFVSVEDGHIGDGD